MGIDDERGTNRFPLLATLRSVVATVVSVLTVVVVVMVITVALRPEEVSLSILQGYIEADTLWKETIVTTHNDRGVYSIPSGWPSRGFGFGSDSGGGGGTSYSYSYSYSPASSVTLLVRLSASNPSGRAVITCKDISVRVLDMAGGRYNFTGMLELQTFPLPDRRFTVERQSSYTVRWMLTINTSNALSYIASTYAGQSSFQAMVQVNATIVSPTTPRGNNISNYCWPVTVALQGAAVARGDVRCKTKEEMGYTIPPAPMAPAA